MIGNKDLNEDITTKAGPEKTSRWTEAERSAPAPEAAEAPESPEPPPPPPWVHAFALGTLVQHNRWWARISGYGQNEDGEIGCFIVPMHPTKASTKR